ncbi:MAG: hypothetical protein QM775_09135 [Pirellulales bacterium]
MFENLPRGDPTAEPAGEFRRPPRPSPTPPSPESSAAAVMGRPQSSAERGDFSRTPGVEIRPLAAGGGGELPIAFSLPIRQNLGIFHGARRCPLRGTVRTPGPPKFLLFLETALCR